MSIWLNNNLTITYEEKDEDIPTFGKIGLQVHGGPPLEVWYKNIAVKELN
ncbi:MAG: family 16 glycoside hydrolase [Opitutales bacterium]